MIPIRAARASTDFRKLILNMKKSKSSSSASPMRSVQNTPAQTQHIHTHVTSGGSGKRRKDQHLRRVVSRAYRHSDRFHREHSESVRIYLQKVRRGKSARRTDCAGYVDQTELVQTSRADDHDV
ncbi:hypothetical protein ElyMa_004034800 [Elysia marginata]|uniref:Uncharacterized protein n=1 Tax=Elysia marginata TaxID=1093978 RepID=A0AAV4G3K8_9GAST|nr:hypothetical protein ElyMa_004034800 [Elysia marginata]